MDTPKIHESEYRFCLIMWEHEPVTAVELAKLCQERLGWKRTTTYTVIKRLGERGVLKNENGTVTSLVSKEEAQVGEIDELVEKRFEGSLPAFIAAFTKRRDISEEELDEVQRMIDRIRKGGRQCAILIRKHRRAREKRYSLRLCRFFHLCLVSKTFEISRIPTPL